MLSSGTELNPGISGRFGNRTDQTRGYPGGFSEPHGCNTKSTRGYPVGFGPSPIKPGDIHVIYTNPGISTPKKVKPGDIRKQPSFVAVVCARVHVTCPASRSGVGPAAAAIHAGRNML